MVPQDPMLFNDTILNNIRYARLSASDQEIYEACKAAAVHDKIMSFPDGRCPRACVLGIPRLVLTLTQAIILPLAIAACELKGLVPGTISDSY